MNQQAPALARISTITFGSSFQPLLHLRTHAVMQ